MIGFLEFDARGQPVTRARVSKWLIINDNTFVWLDKAWKPYKILGNHSAALQLHKPHPGLRLC